MAASGVLWGRVGLSVAGGGAGWVLRCKFTPCTNPSHPLPRFPKVGGGKLHFFGPWGRRLWPRPPLGSCFLPRFQESPLDCPEIPSPELHCSSLVTLLLNNLQNGALPVFIREAFQVCKPDFYAFLVQLPPLPVLPGVTSPRKRGWDTCRGALPKIRGENPQ